MYHIYLEVKNILTALGYNNIEEMYDDKLQRYDLSFTCFGCESFPQRHKDAIMWLCKGYFDSFYYSGDNRQHVYIHEFNDDGIHPDNETVSYEGYKVLVNCDKLLKENLKKTEED